MEWVNTILHNDEVSSDEELIAHFVKNGISEEEAKRLVPQRYACFVNMFYKVK
jgi:hypothetical protein